MLERVYFTLGWFYSGLAILATLLALTTVLFSREPLVIDPSPVEPTEQLPESDSTLPDEAQPFVADPESAIEDSASQPSAFDESSSEAIAPFEESQESQINTVDAVDTDTLTASNAFQEALNKGSEAAELTQTAETEEEWTTVVNLWQAAIAQLESIPESDEQWSEAQEKLEEYRNNRSYAESEVTKLVNAEALTSPY